MDGLINALYSIPVAGVLFQLAGYLVNVVPDISPLILQAATPIALAALCGVMCERAGVVNIGIEGIMITAAFVGWFPSGLVRQFTWSGLGWTLAGAAAFPLAATLVFHLGLRRYASGNRLEVRA